MVGLPPTRAGCGCGGTAAEERHNGLLGGVYRARSQRANSLCRPLRDVARPRWPGKNRSTVQNSAPRRIFMSMAGAEREGAHLPLGGVRVLTLAVNLPGPAAASRLGAMGASVVKVEPPSGDPMARMCPGYYEELSARQEVVCLDLKEREDRASLDDWLEGMDLLLTASRPAALGRLGLAWPELRARFPRLCQVAIVGHPPPDEDVPGHDLTYQARFGTLSPPEMPPVLVADLAGAEQAVGAALSLLFARERGQGAGYEQVALSEAAESFAGPLRWGITAPARSRRRPRWRLSGLRVVPCA
jgi:alpha-methylacyl-CoA racemase